MPQSMAANGDDDFQAAEGNTTINDRFGGFYEEEEEEFPTTQAVDPDEQDSTNLADAPLSAPRSNTLL